MGKGRVFRLHAGEDSERNSLLTLVRDELKQPRYVIAQILDITWRKRSEEEREKLTALIENSGDYIAMATLEGRPFFLNKAGREMVGLAPGTDV